MTCVTCVTSEVAAKAAAVAMQLRPELSEEAGDLLAQVEAARLECVQVRGVGSLSLEVWPESVKDAGSLYTGGAVPGPLLKIILHLDEHLNHLQPKKEQK